MKATNVLLTAILIALVTITGISYVHYENSWERRLEKAEVRGYKTLDYIKPGYEPDPETAPAERKPTRAEMDALDARAVRLSNLRYFPMDCIIVDYTTGDLLCIPR